MAYNDIDNLHIGEQIIPYENNYTLILRNMAYYKQNESQFKQYMYYTGFGVQIYLDRIDASYLWFGIHFDDTFFNIGNYQNNYLNDNWTDFEIYEDTMYQITISYNNPSTASYSTTFNLRVGDFWNDTEGTDDYISLGRYYNGYTLSSYRNYTAGSGWATTSEAQQGININMSIGNFSYQVGKGLVDNWVLKTNEYKGLQDLYAGMSAFDMVDKAGKGVASILSTQILPNITIGTLVFAPLVVLVLVALFRIIKK